VTAVGATTDVPETAAFLSAGGFSNVFEAPSYQTDAIQTYFSSLGDEYAGLFNTSGRGYPDVAAYGMRIPVVNSTANILLGGTSASSPIFASVIALVNDRLLAAGNPPLGFLNPWLYQNPSALNDVPDGSNPGCGTDGFPGIVGWDPVTGLGSPNFPAMLAAAGVEDE
jgi:tripeptidyl-peptidase-1